MKRLIPIFLIACLLIVCLVSCGNKNEETQTETAEVVTAKPRPTTTAPITDGVKPEDEGWSFWGTY
ncbi:MAG: hypothetical protein J6Z79_07410 [Clostridia bacterium]|nr:hypothetical protein [Clostridia bacterium]